MSAWVCAWASIVVLSSIGCGRPSPADPYRLRIGIDDADLLAAELNDNIREGSLARLSSGDNDYPLTLFGSPTYRVRLSMPPRTIVSLLGIAQVQLNDLRFQEARVRWSSAERGLVVRLTIADKADGITGSLRFLQNMRDLTFAVEAASLTLVLEPVASDGRIAFMPLRGEFAANTDDALPAVRDVVRENIRAVSASMVEQANAAFQGYSSSLSTWIAGQLAADAEVTAVAVTSDGMIVSARSRADVNADGRVDIADLVSVARDFGERGAEGLQHSDVNRDGVVDIADLVLVAMRFGL
ncbi:hypothetical protein FJZ36_14330 [Candidatus Poribacteria bacterium]|nr:hypothetical protein [Candidatus Poribacteria bacterium]